MDDESRHIFNERLLYSLTGDKVHLDNLGKEFEKNALESEEWKSFYAQLLAKESEGLVVYAAGYWGRELLEHTKDIEWKAVVDGNPGIDKLCGVEVISLSEYISKGYSYNIVISSRVYYEEIREMLIDKGISENNIIDGAVLFDMSERKQYFDLNELPRAEKEVFADVGCYDGLSAVFFNEWCKGEGFSYCFEPDRVNIERIQRVLKYKNVSNYELIEKGVWDSTTNLKFVSTGNSVSHVMEINGADDNEDNAGVVEVVALDDVLFDKEITFIKMDIEGAEYAALKGASRIIGSQKPKLAICIYHKPQDIWELPELILQLNSEYRFYIRHYSYKDNETVLYAF